MSTLRIGIVGAGLRGRMFAAALTGQPDVRVVGFAEPSVRVRTAAATETGLPVHADHLALLRAEDPDAFIIATPDFAHRGPAGDLARAGKHLLIEKPLATTDEDAEAIVDAVTSGGGRCLVGFENRWNPHVRAAAAARDAGELGAAITASATLSNTYHVPLQMLSWAAASSPAWFLMPHTVDLVTFLLDQRPVSVTAIGSRGVLAARGVDTWDVVHALLRFDEGATASLTSSWVLPDGLDGIVDFRFQLVGDGGAVSADLSHQGLTVATDRQRSPWPVSGRIGPADVGAAAWMAQDFAANLLSGADLGPGVQHGLLVTRVIRAIERSLESGTSEFVG